MTSSNSDMWEDSVQKWRPSWDRTRLFVSITGMRSVRQMKWLATHSVYKDVTDLILNAPTSTAYYKHIQEFNHLECLSLENFSPLQNFSALKKNARSVPRLKLAYTDLLRPSFVDLMWCLGTTELELTGIREIDDEFWIKLCAMLPGLTSLSIREVELSESFFDDYLPQMTQLKKLSLSAFRRNLLSLPSLDVSSLKSLTWLEIGDVDLESLPAGFSELTSLEGLKITNTPLRHLTEATSRSDDAPQKLSRSVWNIFLGLRHLDLSNNGLESLPAASDQMHLETLVARNLDVTKLPRCYYTPTLKVLDLSGSALESLDKNKFCQLKALKELDLSFTRLRKLPDEKQGAEILERLDLRGLTELQRLPAWLSDCTALKELNLGHLHLREFPSLLLLKRECRVYDEVDISRVWENESEEEQEKDLCRILIGGLRQNTIDPQLLLMNNRSLLQQYVEAKDKRPIHRGNLIFLGDPDVGKSTLAEQVTEVSLSDWKQFSGMKILDDSLAYENMFLQSGIDRREQPTRMSRVRVVEMSGYDAAQLIHSFFLTNHSLYVIVLQDGEDLQKRALYWAKLVEAYAPNGHIILAVWYDGKIHHRLDISLLCLSVWMDESPEIIYLDRLDTELDWRAELDRMIVRGLHGLLLDTMYLPDAWIRLLSHLEQLLETRMLLPQDMFDQLVDNYIPQKGGTTSKEDLKRYLFTFEAATVGQLAHVSGEQRGAQRMLYHTGWLSEGLYLLTRQLYQAGERITTVEQSWETLVDLAQHSYSRAQAEILLDFCATHELCIPQFSPKKQYFFPSFNQYEYGDVGNEGAMVKDVDQIRSDPYTVHYIVRCPLLSRMMLTQLMVKIYREAMQKRVDWEKSRIAQTMLLLKFDDNRTLLVLGESGVSTELHLYFSGSRNDPLQDERWHYSVFQHFRAVLELLPEHLIQRYQIAVERTSGSLQDPRFAQRAEISLDDLAGCQRAGYSSYFCGKLNRSYRLQEFTMID